jgi:hypothetical protein
MDGSDDGLSLIGVELGAEDGSSVGLVDGN